MPTLRSNVVTLAFTVTGVLTICTAVMAGYYSSPPGEGYRAARKELSLPQAGGDVPDLGKEMSTLRNEIDKLERSERELKTRLADREGEYQEAQQKQKTATALMSKQDPPELLAQEKEMQQKKAVAKPYLDALGLPLPPDLTVAIADPTKLNVGKAVALLTKRKKDSNALYEKEIQNLKSKIESRREMINTLSAGLAAVEKELSPRTKSPQLLDDTEGLLKTVRDLLSQANTPKRGKNFTNGKGMKMIWVEEGPFWIGEKEVTQGQLTGLGFKNDSSEHVGPNLAANNVTYIDAMQFCIKLQSDEKDNIPAGYNYQLPKVNQWRLAKSKNPHESVKDLDGGVSEWCLDKFTPEMAKENTAAGISDAQTFAPDLNRGVLYHCVLGTSWKNGGANFAKGICALLPSYKRTLTGKVTDQNNSPGTVTTRLSNGEIGFRVILAPAAH